MRAMAKTGCPPEQKGIISDLLDPGSGPHSTVCARAPSPLNGFGSTYFTNALDTRQFIYQGGEPVSCSIVKEFTTGSSGNGAGYGYLAVGLPGLLYSNSGAVCATDSSYTPASVGAYQVAEVGTAGIGINEQSVSSLLPRGYPSVTSCISDTGSGTANTTNMPAYFSIATGLKLTVIANGAASTARQGFIHLAYSPGRSFNGLTAAVLRTQPGTLSINAAMLDDSFEDKVWIFHPSLGYIDGTDSTSRKWTAYSPALADNLKQQTLPGGYVGVFAEDCGSATTFEVRIEVCGWYFGPTIQLSYPIRWFDADFECAMACVAAIGGIDDYGHQGHPNGAKKDAEKRAGHMAVSRSSSFFYDLLSHIPTAAKAVLPLLTQGLKLI